MICETCHGEGEVVTRQPLPEGLVEISIRPCPDCGGCGFTHCCEGGRRTMARKRKTCECCRTRLQPHEDYWCDRCRRSVSVVYHQTQDLFEQLIDCGATPEEAASAMLGVLLK
jgi:hypothetical protein